MSGNRLPQELVLGVDATSTSEARQTSQLPLLRRQRCDGVSARQADASALPMSHPLLPSCPTAEIIHVASPAVFFLQCIFGVDSMGGGLN